MLTIQEIILLFALIGVLGGWALGRFGGWWDNRRAAAGAPSVDHRIRALEAELRIAQRKAEEAEADAQRHREELEALRAEVDSTRAAFVEADAELRQARQQLSEECSKTQSLRVELSERVEETIRARVLAREMETELSVARAGSDAVLDQVRALAAEREELTGRLRTLQLQSESGRLPAAKVARLPVRDPTER